ncbi:hypothetical protein EJB05_46828 [Eragrostis curvula]|uniref:HhH-GPD domain-containing protein n=1 Tax=Eragrostis curvula TaxID=38414 RepID=A0A5J9T6A2_9POAL|nr:hypothetical protein EJB05_46828 [Eragrostis curvula]
MRINTYPRNPPVCAQARGGEERGGECRMKEPIGARFQLPGEGVPQTDPGGGDRGAVSMKKEPVDGNNWTAAVLQSARPKVPTASRGCSAAAVAKIQRPSLLAGADSNRPLNLFEEFRYIPLAVRKAKGQATSACCVRVRQGESNPNRELHCFPSVCGTMATKGSIMLQKQEAGSSATPVSRPVGKVCHCCLCVRSVGSTAILGKKKKELSPQVSVPLSCCYDSPNPFDKFRYTPLAEQKDQEQSDNATPELRRSSSLLLARCSSVDDPKVGRKRSQDAYQEGKLQRFADKRRKAVPATAAGRSNNKKSVSQQKPKRTSSAVLTAAEKRLDMYRRLPPDQLVAPQRQTPYNLIQESYAPDPWKVMVICMLLNRTKGKTIKQIVEGFFTRYPDAQAACSANLDGMVEYLRPTGLQLEKAVRIKKFSSSYLSSDWTYVTELHGVGKYAADAYAIFCAGRVMDVQPEDHKLVDYWKYVCNIGEPWEDEDSVFAI